MSKLKKIGSQPWCSLALQVKEGDHVLYFKWAGDSMETPEGVKYVTVHESDVLCKL